ncbi:MAG: hypothetical protein ACRD0H_25180, partial [Actinomycetes bacterium]
MSAAPDVAGGGQISQGRFPVTAPPTHPLSTWGNTVCRYSTGDDDYERGVYTERGRHWARIGPLPYVLEIIEYYDGAGKQGSPSYRLSPTPLADPARVVQVSDEDLTKGLWAGQIGMDIAGDPKITQTIVTAIRHHARNHNVPVSKSVPAWTPNGELLLPASDVGPAGYGALAPISEASARAAWSQIITEAAAAPKLGLVAGMSLGGLFVRPLGRSSCCALLVGSAGKGKSTAMVTAAA